MMSGCAAAAGASCRVSIEQARPLRPQMPPTSRLTLAAVASRTASERHLWRAGALLIRPRQVGSIYIFNRLARSHKGTEHS